MRRLNKQLAWDLRAILIPSDISSNVVAVRRHSLERRQIGWDVLEFRR
jgi:hypothetical protein